jgi:hypothetical protein
VIKLRRMNCAGNVARTLVLVGKHEGKSHLEDPGIDGRILLRWIFRKWDVGYRLDRSGSG